MIFAVFILRTDDHLQRVVNRTRGYAYAYLHHQNQVGVPPPDGGASTTSGRSSRSSALQRVLSMAWSGGEFEQARHPQEPRVSPPDCVPMPHQQSSASPPLLFPY
jgi:hypothetical protein